MAETVIFWKKEKELKDFKKQISRKYRTTLTSTTKERRQRCLLENHSTTNASTPCWLRPATRVFQVPAEELPKTLLSSIL